MIINFDCFTIDLLPNCSEIFSFIEQNLTTRLKTFVMLRNISVRFTNLSFRFVYLFIEIRKNNLVTRLFRAKKESASAPDVYIKDKLQNVIICDLLGMKEHIFNFDFLSLKRKQLFVFSLER